MSKNQKVSLTSAQRGWLQYGMRDPRGRIWWGVRCNAGGSLRRMMEKLRARGLVRGPPWIITAAGRRAMGG